MKPKNIGWRKSAVFGKSFRLTRKLDDLGHPDFTLDVRKAVADLIDFVLCWLAGVAAMPKAIAIIAAVFIAFCAFLLTILVQDFLKPFVLWSVTRTIVSIAIGLILALLAGRHSYSETLARVQKSARQEETPSKTEQPR